MFGVSSVFLIFDEKVEFYWSRARILEKLNSLPAGALPGGVQPALGPDATALGQVFWYTLEGRDPDGQPAGGWDLHELRSVQDWYVRYGLLSAEGISEVASIGGFVREYQVDVDPDALRAYGVTLGQVYAAVANSNLDVGARVTEINRVEYLLRGVGFIESVADLEEAVVAVSDDFQPCVCGTWPGWDSARPSGAACSRRRAPRPSAAWWSCARVSTPSPQSTTSRSGSTTWARACRRARW
jgi:copper/silver efflux system protein